MAQTAISLPSNRVDVLWPAPSESRRGRTGRLVVGWLVRRHSLRVEMALEQTLHPQWETNFERFAGDVVIAASTLTRSGFNVPSTLCGLETPRTPAEIR